MLLGRLQHELLGAVVQRQQRWGRTSAATKNSCNFKPKYIFVH